MNTLAFITLFEALGWLAVFFATGSSNSAILIAIVVTLFLWAIPMTWVAIKEDQEILR